MYDKEQNINFSVKRKIKIGVEVDSEGGLL